MGGINCPPPPSVPWEELPLGFKQSYTVNLAAYSGHLFSAISSFYAANSMIEKSVSDCGDMLLPIALLETSRQESISARNALSTVEAMWVMIDSDDIDDCVDFEEQFHLLEDVNARIDVVVNLLEMIDSSIEIQTQIWNEPMLTESLSRVVNSFADAMNWQIAFATKYAYQTVGC